MIAAATRAHPAAILSRRQAHLDWLRGVAVLIMIEAHLVDSWTGVPDRNTPLFAWSMVLGGFGAPLFLLLAGLAVPLSAGSKARKGADVWTAALAVMRRGGEIFGLAFVFRVQAWILGWSSYRTLLRVDILNIMGPAIVATAAIWGLCSTARARVAAFLAATLGVSLLTPVMRAMPSLAALPDPIEAYLRPAGMYSGFPIFPWVGFVFAGALIGVLIDRTAAGAGASDARLNTWFGVGGAVLAGTAYAASFLPSPYPRSEFWTSSPSFFLLRLGVLTMAVGLAYAWERRRVWRAGWSWLQQLGRTSLFIYWIHVEMVYGLISLPIHHRLTLPQAGIALVLFSALMLACSVWKDRLVARWRARREVLSSSRHPSLS